MNLINRELKNRLISPETRRSEMKEAQKYLGDEIKPIDIRQQIEKLVILGEGYKLEKKPSLAEEIYLRVIELIQTSRDESMLAGAYKSLGDVWYFCHDYERCIPYYEKAAELLTQQNLIDWSSIISQIAYAYKEIGLREREQKTLEQGIFKTNLPNLIRATFLERLAMSHSVTNARKAIDYYEKALQVYEEADFKRDWEKRVIFLSQLYESLGDTINAQRTLKRL